MERRGDDLTSVEMTNGRLNGRGRPDVGQNRLAGQTQLGQVHPNRHPNQLRSFFLHRQRRQQDLSEDRPKRGERNEGRMTNAKVP
jgi:hypothetical protein